MGGSPKGLYRARRPIPTIGWLPATLHHRTEPTIELTDSAPRRDPASGPASPAAGACPAERGQALVEFAAVLLPILLVVVATIQFGLLFGANVTLTNAAREGARAGTVYLYDTSLTNARTTNDRNRCTEITRAVRGSFGIMSTTAPNFSAADTCASATVSDLNGDGLNDRITNGDIVVSYCSASTTAGTSCPSIDSAASFCTRTDPAGCMVRVQVTYRSDIIVPLIGELLSTDAGGRFVQRAVAVMVVN